MPVLEANHTDILAQDLREIYSSGEHNDIVFKVGNDRIPAHRVILASRSHYFEALLYGGLKESLEKEVSVNYNE